MAQIADYLKTFDEWDRYDLDGDGNFDEPDGFIDHFQIVHAGGDQAAGDPNQGTDAIWSHRWYASVQPVAARWPRRASTSARAARRPAVCRRIPSNPTGVWVGDYTIQPENGGLGVFAHEYAPRPRPAGPLRHVREHRRRGELDRLLDAHVAPARTSATAAATASATHRPTWAPGRSSSSAGSAATRAHGGKFYDVAQPARRPSTSSAPPSTRRRTAQALFVDPAGQGKVRPIVGDSVRRARLLLLEPMRRRPRHHDDEVDRDPGSATLDRESRYEIEERLRLRVRRGLDQRWHDVDAGRSRTSRRRARPERRSTASGTGIDGSTGRLRVTLTAILPAGTTATSASATRPTPGVAELGFEVDNIAINGTPVDRPRRDDGWTFARLPRTTGTETTVHFNAYVVENRRYDGYDTSLKTAYNFGFLNTRPDWVEHFPYQDGAPDQLLGRVASTTTTSATIPAAA